MTRPASVLGEELRAELLGVLRDSVQEPTGVFAQRWVSAAPFYRDIAGQWLWDAAYMGWALARATGDVAAARDVVRTAVGCQVADGPDAGMLLHNPRTDGTSPALTAGTSQTPLIAWLAARLHELSPDPTFVRDVYPCLSRHVRWWRSPRRDFDGDGLAEYAGPTAKAALHESGLDVAPVRDLLLLDPPGRSADGLFHDVVADVGLNSALYAECQALAVLAESAAPQEADQWRAEAASIAATMRARMWCPEVGAYMPAVRTDLAAEQTWVTHLTPHVLLPVWAGVASPEETRATLSLITGDWREFPTVEGRARIDLGVAEGPGGGVAITTDALRPRLDGIRAGTGVQRHKEGWHAANDVEVLTLEWPRDRAVSQEWFTRLQVTLEGAGDIGIELETGDGHVLHATATATDDGLPVVFGDVSGPPRQPLHGLARLTLRARAPHVTVSAVEIAWARQRPRGLLSRYGIRSLHPLDGKFPAGDAPTHFWCGTVWAPYVWHACHALHAAGSTGLAVEQSRAFREAVRAAFRQGFVAPEHLSASDGVGMGAMRQGWTAAVALLLEEEMP